LKNDSRDEISEECRMVYFSVPREVTSFKRGWCS